MSQTELNTAAVSWRDYLELCKPNVVALMILTSVIGMVLATQQSVPLSVLIFGNLGIALCAGSAAAVNHIVDRHVDDKMARTLNRPLAQGRITPRQAILFALITGLLGMAILLIFTNVLTAWLTLASLVGYAFIYTMFLKRATPQNIVIGGLAGAAPPLLGWTAVTGEIHHNALLLVLIIFAWTPPHFWALAIKYKDDYAAANVPMLPVVATRGRVHQEMWLHTVAMIVSSIALIRFADLQLWALILTIGLGLVFAGQLIQLREKTPDYTKVAGKIFQWSITYLSLLSVVLVAAQLLS